MMTIFQNLLKDELIFVYFRFGFMFFGFAMTSNKNFVFVSTIIRHMRNSTPNTDLKFSCSFEELKLYL